LVVVGGWWLVSWENRGKILPYKKYKGIKVGANIEK